jgi:hypothetical protein
LRLQAWQQALLQLQPQQQAAPSLLVDLLTPLPTLGPSTT